MSSISYDDHNDISQQIGVTATTSDGVGIQDNSPKQHEQIKLPAIVHEVKTEEIEEDSGDLLLIANSIRPVDTQHFLKSIETKANLDQTCTIPATLEALHPKAVPEVPTECETFNHVSRMSGVEELQPSNEPEEYDNNDGHYEQMKSEVKQLLPATISHFPTSVGGQWNYPYQFPPNHESLGPSSYLNPASQFAFGMDGRVTATGREDNNMPNLYSQFPFFQTTMNPFIGNHSMSAPSNMMMQTPQTQSFSPLQYMVMGDPTLQLNGHSQPHILLGSGGTSHTNLPNQFMMPIGMGPLDITTLPIQKRINKGRIEHFCPFVGCNYKSFKSTNLVGHIRQHTGEKPYKCTFPDCNYSSSQLSNIKVHERLHYGIKPYACDFPGCTYAANQNSNLKAHKRRTHPNSEISPSVASSSEEKKTEYSSNNNKDEGDQSPPEVSVTDEAAVKNNSDTRSISSNKNHNINDSDSMLI